MIVPLVKACQDPQLLGAALQWRARQLEVLARFGDDALRLVVVAAGRQGGKSSMAVATAIWGATMRDDLDQLMPKGRTRFALIACPSEDQSRELIRVAAGMVDASPVLRGLATVRADRIDFTLPSGAKTAIQALPANPRTVRGVTASLVIGDETAHLQSDAAGVNNDARMIEALEGSMSVFDAVGKSKMLLISTPSGEQGRFFELFNQAQDGTIAHAAAVHAPAWELNPALDTEEWRESKRRLLGVDGFEQEHGARFVAGGGAFLDLRDIYLEAGPAPVEAARAWTIGLDAAFSHDRFGIAAVGESVDEPGTLVVGHVEAIEPGGRLLSLDARRSREDRTLRRVLQAIQPYADAGPLRVVGDQHQADPIRSYLGRKGIAFDSITLTATTQTAAFVALRTRLSDGSLRLWREPGLLEDLRRVRAKDTETIHLPRYAGGHCDSAAALALAVYELRHVDGGVEHELIVGWSTMAAEIRALDTDQFAGGSLAPALTAGLRDRML